MYIILKTTKNDIDQFVVYNKISRAAVATYSTYAEAFQDVLSRRS
jgi:hypothetical protein